MATDKSPPRAGLILKGSVIAIATLIATHSALVAYFDHYAQAEEQRKFGDMKPEALMSLREAEKERLHAGPVPIDKAMQQLAAGGRTASPDIMPTASKDLAALQGGTLMPSQVPPEMTSAQAAPAPSAQPSVDAGAAPAPAAPPKGKPDRAHPDRGPTPSKPPKNP
jgi:hypothetical protein